MKLSRRVADLGAVPPEKLALVGQDAATRAILVDTVQRLFTQYGARAEFVSDINTQAPRLCATIGIDGDLVGGISVTATESALTATIPIAGGDTRTWIHELASQLGGHFASALSCRGVAVSITPPLATLTPVPAHAIEPISMKIADGGWVCVWLVVSKYKSLGPA